MAPGDGGDGRDADYYEILGVPDTATGDDIIRAYRRLARQHHPDHNPAGGSGRFQEITHAYDVIGDAERRRHYDAQRRSGTAGGTGRRGGIRIPVRQVIRLSAQQAALGGVVVVHVTEPGSATRRPVKVRVPAGVRDGATLRIRPKDSARSFEAVVRIV
ncbi:MAG: DnaJ domain-containing protein [Actinomycetota bacterium]|jgi:DnaJ-class molecular chaperone